jgi:predicted PurR-regulated permease PerM
MLIVTILTAIGLYAMGMPLVLFLSVFAGVMAFIPNFGPIIALIPALLVAMTQSPTTALYVLILYMAVQVIESNLITPFIQREMVALPLAVIIVAQVVLGILVGGLGLILATPIVAIAMVLVRMLYIQDVLARRRYKNINGWDNYFTEGCAKL